MKKQMHGLLSLMLSLILVVGMIPGSLMTAHAAETTVISSVNLTGFIVPSAGDNATAAKPAATIESGKGYTLIDSGWTDSTGIYEFSGNFKADVTYTAWFLLSAEEGYKFTSRSSFSPTVKDDKGNDVTIASRDVRNGSKEAVVRVTFTIPAEGGETPAPTEIDEIKIEGLPAPQYGQASSQRNDVFNNNCDTGVLKINGSIGVDGWNFGDVFLDGKSLMDETMKHFYETITAGTYYVKLWLYHSEGFVFADGLSITVDGVNPANVTFEQDPDEEECKIVYVKYEITAPSSAPTEYDITVNCFGDIDYTVSGKTVTVNHEVICKVGYLSGEKYEYITAAKNTDGTYSYTAPDSVTEVILFVNGDVTGDGAVDSTDYLRIKGHFVGTYTITGIAFESGDVTSDGVIDSTDYIRIKGHFLGTYNLHA